MSSTIGKQLAALRESRQRTQADVAEATGTTQATISRIEAGAKLPSVPMLEKILAAYGLKIGFSPNTKCPAKGRRRKSSI